MNKDKEFFVNVSSIEFKDAKGEIKTLKDYPAKVYLLVNVASKCGLTPQYKGLQELYDKYHDQGLEIMAYPANEFLGQEPGTNEEIQQFCSLNYNVSFPVHQKIIVKGEGQHPLYSALTKAKTTGLKEADSKFEEMLTSKGLISGEAHDIKWNFEKFLVSAEGEVLARFAPDVDPAGDLVLKRVEAAL